MALTPRHNYRFVWLRLLTNWSTLKFQVMRPLSGHLTLRHLDGGGITSLFQVVQAFSGHGTLPCEMR